MKDRSKGFRLALLIAMAVALSACISHQQYRTEAGLCVSANPLEECARHTMQLYRAADSSTEEYHLGFVEFDDQGQLWDRRQLRQVVGQVNTLAANQDLLMVVFVHGWKHSAQVGDSNIASFRESLRRLSALESAISVRTGSPPRAVVGIYLGWRGGSVSLPGLKELTFWERKNTAHKVGRGGATELFSRLELVQKTKRALSLADGKPNRTRYVVVGHSFGGALVFSAVSEILENGFVQTHGPDAVVSGAVGFADLVVLINPAFEAARYSTLSDMAIERRRYFQDQLPVFVVLTSEDDGATGVAFPMGRWFSTLFETEREAQRFNPVLGENETIDQGSANMTALGHFDPYLTHYLRARDTLADREHDAVDLSAEVQTFVEASKGWEADKSGSRIPFEGAVLERTESSAGRNPYLNIRVDGELIRDHNDIYDPRIASFIRQLILISSQSQDLERRVDSQSKMVKP
jgi:pimeloyl-ACP methyl ester carboxylesterase